MTDGPSNNGKETRFQLGNRAGRGRPAGSRNRATLVLDKMAEDDAKDIARKLLDAAKGGDMRAAELVLARVWPVRKGRPVSLALPAIETAEDVVKALGFVASAVGAGEVTPEEGAAVAGILETKRRAIETSDFEKRLSALEKERSK